MVGNASILMCLKQNVKQTKKEMKDGRDKGRGVCWPSRIEYFPGDFVEGFSAAWLNKQQ